MALLVLLAGPTPAGIVAADLLLTPALDRGPARSRRRRAVVLAGRGRRHSHPTGSTRRGDLAQGGGLGIRGAAGIVERGRAAAPVAGAGAIHLRGVDFDLGIEDELAELLPDRVHQLLEHREAFVFVC